MKAGNGVSVLDPYEWLPGHGETSVEVHTSQGNLYVEIKYDGVRELSETKRLIFDRAVDFRISSLPGVKTSKVEYEVYDGEDYKIGDLVEFPESQAAMAWTKHFASYTIRHFKIWFTNANVQLEIFAEGFVVSDV